MLANTAGFQVQFPVFDASVLTNWNLTQEGIETVPLATPGTGFGWPMVGSKLFVSYIPAMLTTSTSNKQSPSGRGAATADETRNNSFEPGFLDTLL